MKTTTRIFIAITASVLLTAFIAPIIMLEISKPKPEWMELTEWEAMSFKTKPFNSIAFNRTDSISQIYTPVKINVSHSDSIDEARININEGWSEWADVTVNADTLWIDIKVNVDKEKLKLFDYISCEMNVDIKLPAGYMHGIVNYDKDSHRVTANFSDFKTDNLSAQNILFLNFDNCNVRKLSNITERYTEISTKNGTVVGTVSTQLYSTSGRIAIGDDCPPVDSLTVIPTGGSNELDLSCARLLNLSVQPVDTCSEVDIRFGYNTLSGNVMTSR